MHKIDHTSQRIAYSKLAASKTERNRKQRQSEEEGGSGDPTQTSIFFFTPSLLDPTVAPFIVTLRFTN